MISVLSVFAILGAAVGQGAPWECRSANAMVTDVPIVEHRQSSFGQEIWEYRSEGVRVFGLPASGLGHSRFDERVRGIHLTVYSASLAGSVEQVRASVIHANPELRCEAQGPSYWCDDPTRNSNARLVFIGPDAAGGAPPDGRVRLTCSWEEPLRP